VGKLEASCFVDEMKRVENWIVPKNNLAVQYLMKVIAQKSQ
jgi:hypothetical protein